MNDLGFLLIIAAIIGIFFLIRGLMCWYWKVNERLELQKETNRLLKEISVKLTSAKVESEKLLTV